MIANPKTKGGSFERKLSKKISLWWTNGEEDSLCWRTASSGARATQRDKTNQKTINAHGDICATDPDIQPFFSLFSVEAKRGYNKVNLINHIDSEKNPEFESLWSQCLNDANKCNKQPMLVLKRDRKSEVVFIHKHFYNKLTECLNVLNTEKIVLIYRNRDTIIGMRLDDFLDWLEPETVRMLANGKDQM